MNNQNRQMRIIATADDYVLAQELSGVVSLYRGAELQISNACSAYELICEIPEKSTRLSLLRQWKEDLDGQRKAEEMTPVVEGILKGDR